MRKLLFTLIACCSLNCFAVDEQQQSQKRISAFVDGSKKPKESFLLRPEKFSNSENIDYDGLEDHIHYQFKDKTLLRDALYSLLPKRLKADKLKFEHLEFLGDSVLGLVIRERLVILFPKANRGTIVRLYELLTQNQTLADVYFRNLELERYIPVPERESCKICNLVESLIGGIYLDDLVNGYINSKKFVMHILNDHVLEEKIREISLPKGIELAPEVFPALEEAIKRVCTPERLEFDSPKTLLNEVLLCLWTDRPTYEVSVKMSEEGLPIFSAIVSGAQIGKVLQGEGDTTREAEEDAARNALNFLAKGELLQKKDKERANKTFRTRLKECLDVLGYKWKFENATPQSTFKVQIKFQNEVVGEGTGASHEEAKKIAAHQAYLFHKSANIFQEDRMQRSKNYRSLLKEFFELAGSSNYKLGEPELIEDIYNCQVEIEGNPIANGTGPNKVGAREDAAKKAFLFLGKEKAENYSPLLQLFLMFEGLDHCEFNSITSCQTFLYRVLDGENMVGEGVGLTDTEAKETAAREAYFRLIQIETEKAAYREKLNRGERLISSTPKPIISLKQQAVGVSPLPQKSVSKQPSSDQNIEEGSSHKKTIKKRTGKAALSQRRTKPDEPRTKSPAPKVQSELKSPRRELSKPYQKPAVNQASGNQVSQDFLAKNSL